MSRRTGFTLVELVVVVMILGILAAVAVPKLLSTTGTATDNSLRQTLGVIRDAIEVYASQHQGVAPGQGTGATALQDDIKLLLRNTFPASPVGTKDATVAVVSVDANTDLTATGATGWMYNKKDGRFIANCTDVSNDGVTPYNKF